MLPWSVWFVEGLGHIAADIVGTEGAGSVPGLQKPLKLNRIGGIATFPVIWAGRLDGGELYSNSFQRYLTSQDLMVPTSIRLVLHAMGKSQSQDNFCPT